jgi:hypothetical protein
MFVMIVVICICPGTAGQDRPAWVSQLEVLLQKQESKWTLIDKDVRSGRGYFHEVIKLKLGSLRAEVSIEILESAEQAREQFEGEEIAFTNILEKHAVKSRLDGLGDENFLFTGRGKRKNGNIFLIQSNVVVKVFAPSAETAKRFTRYVVNLMPPSNRRLERTRR